MDPVTEEIRQRADLADIVGEYVQLQPAGVNRFKARCPFHEEKTPSFYVSRDHGFFKCFGCGAAGDVFSFVQKIRNLSFVEAKNELAERYQIALPRRRELSSQEQVDSQQRERLARLLTATVDFYRKQLGTEAGAGALEYARRRGLTNEILSRFSIGYAPDSWDALQRYLINQYGFKQSEAIEAGVSLPRDANDPGRGAYDRFRHRLMFPIWDERGHVVAFGGRILEGSQTGSSDAKYLNSPETSLFHKSQLLYAWHLARAESSKAGGIIITEGYMDTIALHSAGFGNTVATLGTALSKPHVAMLKRINPARVWLCFDGDSAGLRAALRTAPLFEQASLDVRVVKLPSAQDPDSLVREFGNQALQQLLDEAPLLRQFELEQAIQGFDLTVVGDRKKAVAAAAGVLRTVAGVAERDAYVAWLTDKLASSFGATTSERIQVIQNNLRRELAAAGHSAPAGPEDRRAAAPIPAPQVPAAYNMLPAGLVRAERALLAAMLSANADRPEVLRLLPPEQWVVPEHRSIIMMLDELEAGEEGNALSEMTELLSPALRDLVAELLQLDEAHQVAEAPLLKSWAQTVVGYHERQHQHDVLTSIAAKIKANEPISEEERQVYQLAISNKTRSA